jgi:type VI secretion system secreted protein VgrG
MAITQDNRLLAIEVDDLGKDVLLLDHLVGVEQISQPFRFELTLLSEIAEGNPSKVHGRDLLGKGVTISIGLAGGERRIVRGLIRRFAEGEKDKEFVHYRAEVVPWLSLLEMSSHCRIFQNMTAPEVIEEVLGDYSFSDVDPKLDRTYTKRDYCTQYRETDLNFISRLMEEEGIYYFFRHAENGLTMVLADATSAYKPCPVGDEVTFGTELADPDKGQVHSWEIRQQLLPGKWKLRDYDFQQPRNKLEVEAPAVQPAEIAQSLEMYDFPGGYVRFFNAPDARTGKVQDEGDTVAELRMEQEEAQGEIAEGDSNDPGFTIGHTFTLGTTGMQEGSGSYTLTSVQHSASQLPSYEGTSSGEGVGYHNRFVCIPESVTYRPPLRTPKPIISGLQSAKVVDESDPSGEPSEEIWPDKYGRVRVRFPWDPDSKFSCWVRVTQHRAGKSGGFIWIPRVGDEVVVAFLEGDPDCPLIVGSLYNADNPVPYTLPANKTQSGVKTRSTMKGGSDNYNELRFEDKKGSELITLHAEKDLLTEVENDETRTVGHDRTTTIKNNETKTINDGDEKITLEKGSQTVKIYQDQSTTIDQGKCELIVSMGDQLTQVKMGKQDIKVDMGDQSTEIGMGNQKNNVKMGNITTEAGMGNISTEAKLGNITIKADLGQITVEALQGIELKVGPSSIKIDMTGITIKGMMASVEGQVQTQIKGLITQVTADAMLKAGGAITMIG